MNLLLGDDDENSIYIHRKCSLQSSTSFGNKNRYTFIKCCSTSQEACGSGDCFDLLKNLHKHYAAGTIEVKHIVIGSIFPEKLIFEKSKYRTTNLNEAFALICNDNKPSNKNKNGKNLLLNKSSRRVVSPRIELGSNV